MRTLIKVLVLSVAVGLASCASLNPFSHAKTMDQKAYALYGSFVVAETQAAKMMASVEVPVAVKNAIKKADAVAKPAADNLLDTAMLLSEVRKGVAAGITPEERLKLAIDKLDDVYYSAKPKIEELVKIVNGGK